MLTAVVIGSLLKPGRSLIDQRMAEWLRKAAEPPGGDGDPGIAPIAIRTRWEALGIRMTSSTQSGLAFMFLPIPAIQLLKWNLELLTQTGLTRVYD